MPLTVLQTDTDNIFNINKAPILFLNNEIGLSLAALKDIIQLGISTNFLIAGLVVAYSIQDINEKVEKSKSRISDYGKEVVRVEQDA